MASMDLQVLVRLIRRLVEFPKTTSLLAGEWKSVERLIGVRRSAKRLGIPSAGPDDRSAPW